ncbi:hypothetical protein GCM10009716_22610 [Streptomyces sodiiphilus]|uniref:Uncharacterized protein n=1 Tax=Streptomyces sodiiphilus TaxID=226217 RepID=A0ABP5AF24_9ACTN
MTRARTLLTACALAAGLVAGTAATASASDRCGSFLPFGDTHVTGGTTPQDTHVTGGSPEDTHLTGGSPEDTHVTGGTTPQDTHVTGGSPEDTHVTGGTTPQDTHVTGTTR